MTNLVQRCEEGAAEEAAQAAPASQKAPQVAAGRGAVGIAKGTARRVQHPSKKPPLLAAGGSAVGTANGNCTARSL